MYYGYVTTVLQSETKQIRNPNVEIRKNDINFEFTISKWIFELMIFSGFCPAGHPV